MGPGCVLRERPRERGRAQGGRGVDGALPEGSPSAVLRWTGGVANGPPGVSAPWSRSPSGARSGAGAQEPFAWRLCRLTTGVTWPAQGFAKGVPEARLSAAVGRDGWRWSVATVSGPNPAPGLGRSCPRGPDLSSPTRLAEASLGRGENHPLPYAELLLPPPPKQLRRQRCRVGLGCPSLILSIGEGLPLPGAVHSGRAQKHPFAPHSDLLL